MRLALFIFFTRRDKKALRVKAIIIPAGNSSKNNGKTRAINVKWWCDFFLKVWLFKFIIDSSPPLKNKWGSGEQSAVSSRSNFVALTCLQIKRGKLPAGGEVAERSEELRKRESGLRFMIEFSVPPSAAFFLKASPIKSLRLHRQAPTIQSILIAHRSWSSRIAHQWSLWLSLMLFAFLFNCWTRVRLNEGRVQTDGSIYNDPLLKFASADRISHSQTASRPTRAFCKWSAMFVLSDPLRLGLCVQWSCVNVQVFYHLNQTFIWM